MAVILIRMEGCFERQRGGWRPEILKRQAAPWAAKLILPDPAGCATRTECDGPHGWTA